MWNPIEWFRSRFGDNETSETSMPPSPGGEDRVMLIVVIAAAVFFVGSLK